MRGKAEPVSEQSAMQRKLNRNYAHRNRYFMAKQTHKRPRRAWSRGNLRGIIVNDSTHLNFADISLLAQPRVIFFVILKLH